ncbi:MAG: TolC family protein [Spirochaetota bacterium]
MMRPLFKSLIFTAVIAGITPAAYAQLTLEQCQAMAAAHYPLVKQYGIIEKTAGYTISSANRGYLPQLSAGGKSTYQSDVTTLPIKVPGITVTPPDKDQYQITAEASQVLWDGGAIGAQKDIARANALAEKKKLDADIYALRGRIDQLFFGILLLDEQLAQNETYRAELETNFRRIESYRDNGIANQSDCDALRVEILNAQQARASLAASRDSFRAILSAFTGIPAAEIISLVRPDGAVPAEESVTKRPELAAFDAQEKLIEAQKDAVRSASNPKIGAFLQGGYGKPGLNMLSNDPSSFYVAGGRFTWNLGTLYTRGNSLSSLNLAQKGIRVQKETFLFNNSLSVTRQRSEIAKLRTQIESDEEIISLRRGIRKAAEAKLENGAISVSDLVREMNAENLALQQKSFHQIQLLSAVYDLKNLLNE